MKFSNHSFDCGKQTHHWFKASSKAETIQRQRITNTAHRGRLATHKSAEIVFLYPEFLIRDIQLNNDPHIARGRSDPLVLPDPGATVLCCINSEFLGAPKAVPSVIQRPVNKLLVVHFLQVPSRSSFDVALSTVAGVQACILPAWLC